MHQRVSRLGSGFDVVILRNSSTDGSSLRPLRRRRSCRAVRCHLPRTFRCEEQDALPPAPSAMQVHRPPSSIVTGATSTQKKLPSCTKWNLCPSNSCSLFRCHDTCDRTHRLFLAVGAPNTRFLLNQCDQIRISVVNW